MLVAAIFHSALPSPKTARLLLSFLLSHLESPWGGSRHTLLLSLLDTISTLFPIHTLLTLAAPPPNFSIPNFPMRCLHILHTFATLTMLRLFFHRCFTTVPHLVLLSSGSVLLLFML